MTDMSSSDPEITLWLCNVTAETLKQTLPFAAVEAKVLDQLKQVTLHE